MDFTTPKKKFIKRPKKMIFLPCCEPVLFCVFDAQNRVQFAWAKPAAVLFCSLARRGGLLVAGWGSVVPLPFLFHLVSLVSGCRWPKSLGAGRVPPLRSLFSSFFFLLLSCGVVFCRVLLRWCAFLCVPGCLVVVPGVLCCFIWYCAGLNVLWSSARCCAALLCALCGVLLAFGCRFCFLLSCVLLCCVFLCCFDVFRCHALLCAVLFSPVLFLAFLWCSRLLLSEWCPAVVRLAVGLVSAALCRLVLCPAVVCLVILCSLLRCGASVVPLSLGAVLCCSPVLLAVCFFFFCAVFPGSPFPVLCCPVLACLRRIVP